MRRGRAAALSPERPRGARYTDIRTLATWYFNDTLAEAPSPPGVLKRRNNKEISSPINRICSFPGKSGSGYRQ